MNYPFVGALTKTWLRAAIVLSLALLASADLIHRARSQLGPVGIITPYITSNFGTTGGLNLASPAIVGQTTYLCGVSYNGAATAAVTVAANIFNLKGNEYYSYILVPQNGVGSAPFNLTFTPCLPASAPDLSIAWDVGAAGVGGTVGSAMWGYTQ